MELLNETRINILSTISKKKLSPQEIAKKLNLSVANVNNHLQLLCASGLVKKERAKNSSVGKPRTLYTIAKEVLLLTLISSSKVDKKMIKPDKHHLVIINTWLSNIRKEDHFFIEKFYYCMDDIRSKLMFIGFIKSDDKEIELFILADPSTVHLIRQKYSNIHFRDETLGERKFVIWSHTLEEVENGLKRKEQYFINLVENSQPLLEHTPNLLLELKKRAGLNEQVSKNN